MDGQQIKPAALVLVVEDEPIQRMSLVDTLEEGGFEVLEAAHAAQAFSILEGRSDVRLVVTDIEMPGAMDGIALAAAVRDKWPPIEVLLLSAGPPPAPDTLPDGAEFISKPILTDRLLARVRRMAEHL